MIPTSESIVWAKTPRVVWGLIAVCIAVYAFEFTLSAADLKALLEQYALVPRRYTHPGWAAEHGLSRLNPLPFLSSLFLHGGLFHILSNLWVLWIFGPPLEDRLGSGRFLALYLASGLVAGFVHLLFNLGSDLPALGASGAIAGLIAGFARRFPYAWVNVLQPVLFIPIFFMLPAMVFAGLWFAVQILHGTGAIFAPNVGGVAWFAHIGGFLAGWVLLRWLAPPHDLAREQGDAVQSALWPWTLWWRWWSWWWPKR